MDLQSIINLNHVRYMTQISADPYQKQVVVATDEKGDIDAGDLESRLEKAGYTKHARSQALKGVDSLNYLNMHMARLERTGVLQEQRDYFRSIGYNYTFPDDYRVAVSGKNGVVAFTDGKILGVTTDFKKKLKYVAKAAGVSEEIAAEYISFHENDHKAQPSYIFNDELSAEMDAESRATDFFTRKQKGQKTLSGKRNYKRMAAYARKKLSNYQKQVKRSYKRAA